MKSIVQPVMYYHRPPLVLLKPMNISTVLINSEIDLSGNYASSHGKISISLISEEIRDFFSS